MTNAIKTIATSKFATMTNDGLIEALNLLAVDVRDEATDIMNILLEYMETRFEESVYVAICENIYA
jgi:hypothetical protein